MAYTVGTPQSGEGSGSATNIATSAAVSVSAGDTIVVIGTVAQVDLTASLVCSDGTNTYSLKFAIYDSGTTANWCIFVAENVSAGSYTPTMSWGGSTRTSRAIYAIPVSGLKAACYQTGAIAVQASPGTGTDGVTTGNMTPTEQPACVIGGLINGGSIATPAAGTGFTSIGTAWQFGTGTNLFRAEHKRITSTSATPLTGTAGANVKHFSVAVILSEAGGSTATATPNHATLTASGLAPTLSTVFASTAAPTRGAATAAGLVPALARILGISPTQGGITLGGLSPTSLPESGIGPTTGLAQALGLSPSLTLERRIDVGVGTAIASGVAPTVTGDGAVEGSSTPAPGSITAAGLAPTLYLERLVTPAQGAIALQGLAPVTLAELLGLPGAGAAQAQGLAPTLLRELLLQPGSALAQVLGLAPTEGRERTVGPGVGLAQTSGGVPTYGVPGQAITEPGSAALAAVGLSPTLVGLKISAAPDVGVATVVGLAPTLSATSSSEPIGRSYPGQKKRGARGRTSQSIYDYSAPATVSAPTQGPPPTVPGTPQPTALRVSLGELGGLDLRAMLAPKPEAPIVAPDAEALASEERARARRRREEQILLKFLMAA